MMLLCSNNSNIRTAAGQGKTGPRSGSRRGVARQYDLTGADECGGSGGPWMGSIVPEHFQHLGRVTGPPSSHVLVLAHAGLTVPELVGDCSGCLAGLVHQRGDGLAEDMARHPVVAAVLERCSKVSLSVARIAKPTF